jgi:adenylosuccinate synthase
VGIQKWDELPKAAQTYLKRVEEVACVPIAMVSTGPDRNETILLQHPFEA